jgi:uncharacterized protein YegJ (DUF2314 family)
MRQSSLLSLIGSAITVAAFAGWSFKYPGNNIALMALAASGLWFALCLIRALGKRLGSSTPDFTRGGGFGRIPSEMRWNRNADTAETGNAGTHDRTAEPLLSLVLLLSDPRSPTEATISGCVSSALAIDLDPEDLHATQFVIRMPDHSKRAGSGEVRGIEHFMVKLDHGVFGVLSSNRPYVEKDHQNIYRDIRDKRLRTAIETHRAWISVDLMGQPENNSEKDRAYRVIGKIIAAMAGPDCLAICCPELEACNEFDPGLIENLQSSDPLDIFADPTFAPVIEVDKDNPAMLEAVAEARDRWSEFVEALPRDCDDERYLAKVEFCDQEISEFMWVQVTAADDQTLHGLLVNEPHQIENVHCGQKVSVPVEQLNDWIYPDNNGKMVGGFTLAIIAGAENGDEESGLG